jgi:hypothetical protein
VPVPFLFGLGCLLLDVDFPNRSSQEQATMNRCTKMRRIAANIAKLPELLRKA